MVVVADAADASVVGIAPAVVVGSRCFGVRIAPAVMVKLVVAAADSLVGIAPTVGVELT